MTKEKKKKEPQIIEIHIYIHQLQPIVPYVPPQSPTAPNPYYQPPIITN